MWGEVDLGALKSFLESLDHALQVWDLYSNIDVTRWTHTHSYLVAKFEPSEELALRLVRGGFPTWVEGGKLHCKVEIDYLDKFLETLGGHGGIFTLTFEEETFSHESYEAETSERLNIRMRLGEAVGVLFPLELNGYEVYGDDLTRRLDEAGGEVEAYNVLVGSLEDFRILPNDLVDGVELIARIPFVWEMAKELAEKVKNPDYLRRLAGDEDWGVREAVAENPNTPPDVLARLAGDEDPGGQASRG